MTNVREHSHFNCDPHRVLESKKIIYFKPKKFFLIHPGVQHSIQTILVSNYEPDLVFLELTDFSMPRL